MKGNNSISENQLNLELEKYDLDDFALEKLNLNIQRIEKGTEDVVETPLIKFTSAESVLSKWDKVFQDNIDKLNDVLKEIELKQKDKIGPRSKAKPWDENKDTIYNYFDRSYPNYTYSLDCKPSGSLRPLSLARSIDFLKNNTAAGLPSMLKTKDVKPKLLKEGYLEKELEMRYPCVMFTRTQESYKTRYVWGYPKSWSTEEMRYYIPLQAEQKKKKWRKALLGPGETDQAITEMINFAVSSDKTLMSIDFTAYDASVTPVQIQIASSYIKSYFQKSFHPYIDRIMENFSNIGIITPDGILNGLHGIPSGSTLTNEVGSIVQYSIYKDMGFVYLDYLQCQGDDGALVVDDSDVDKLLDELTKYGQETNKTKCTIAKDWIVYLQNLYHIDYMKDGIIGGIYPIYRALCRLMYQERWSDFEKYGIEGKDYYSIRTIQILENCKFHPLFEEFVKFVYDQDKYNLRFTDEGLSLYIRMINEKQGKSG